MPPPNQELQNKQKLYEITTKPLSKIKKTNNYPLHVIKSNTPLMNVHKNKQLD